MINISADIAKQLVIKARTRPTEYEKYCKIIRSAICQAAKKGRTDIFVDTYADLTPKERQTITAELVESGFRVKWHDINDDIDEKIHIMWSFD